MTHMLDDRFDDQLRESARDYHTPPPTPKEEMWAAIMAARNEGTRERGNEGNTDDGSVLPASRRSRVPSFRPLRWVAGIAALLALGIGLGRLSVPRSGSSHAPVVAVAGDSAPRSNDLAYRIAATEHLGQSEAFLTLFRTSVRRGGNEELASATARQLLATNRLLLDSPAAGDAQTRLLLQDLELVLAEIAQLSPRPSSPDLDLITEGLERGGVMSRLRTAVPSGASTTQGVL
jgi:hypothetical protein